MTLGQTSDYFLRKDVLGLLKLHFASILLLQIPQKCVCNGCPNTLFVTVGLQAHGPRLRLKQQGSQMERSVVCKHIPPPQNSEAGNVHPDIDGHLLYTPQRTYLYLLLCFPSFTGILNTFVKKKKKVGS